METLEKSNIRSMLRWIKSSMPLELRMRLTRLYFLLRHIDKSDGLLPKFFPKQNKKNRYVIFRYNIPNYELFAAGIQFIFSAEYADKKGYIPLIDIETTYNFENGNCGESNIWDFVFEQLNIKDILANENSILATVSLDYSRPNFCRLINGKGEDHFIHIKQDGWRDYYAKVNLYSEKYWHIKPEIEKEIEEYIESYFEDNERIIAVSLREMMSKKFVDKMRGKRREVAEHHPYNLEVKDIITIVRGLTKEWGAKKIFVSTQYTDSIDLFIKEFGAENIIYTDRKRIRYDEVVIDETFSINTLDKHRIRMEADEKFGVTKAYFVEVCLMSQCDYFVASHSSGSAAALIMNGGKYKDIFVLDDLNHIGMY